MQPTLTLAGVRRRLDLWPYAALALASALAFAVLCDDVGEHDGLTRVDPGIATWFAAHRTALDGQLGLLLATATSPAVLVALVLLGSGLLWWKRHRVAAYAVLGATVAAYGTGWLAKHGEHRARPSAPVNLAPESEPSFPSGHALVVATLAAVVLGLAWRHLGRTGRVVGSLLAAGVVLLVALDRLVVGAHWFTDVLGSLVLAAAIAAVTLGVRHLVDPPA